MTISSVELLEGEQLMSDEAELAFRQMAPHMFEDGGRISTAVFGPSTSDHGKPSYSRSSVVTAQQAREESMP